MRKFIFAASMLALACAAPAFAESADEADKTAENPADDSAKAESSQITAASLLAAPSAASVLNTRTETICTDRPTNGNYACTVPKGMVQIEADAFGWTTDRFGGARNDEFAVASTVIKYGLSDSSDIQIAWTPYNRVRVRDAAGLVTTDEGVSDVTLLFKQRLTNPEDPVQVALLPFVSLPTASAGVGSGKVEGGIAVPINYYIPGDWVLTFGPQLNILTNEVGSGRHVGVRQLINMAKSFGNFTIINELSTDWNFDPAGTIRQYSYNNALVWLANPNLQFDIGTSTGLNRNTPDFAAYVGISTRF